DSTTGILTPAGSVAAGTLPVAVIVEPSGRFAYVANQGSGDISEYSINQSSGALTLISTATSGTTQFAITVALGTVSLYSQPGFAKRFHVHRQSHHGRS